MSTSSSLLIRFLILPIICTFSDSGLSYAESNFNSDESLYNYARTLDLTASWPLFDKLVASDPRKYIGERAKMFAQNGASERALNDFNEAVKLDPNLWLSARASFLLSSGAISGAQEDWQTLINLRKNNLDQLQPGTKEFSRGTSELARAYFARGLASGSSSPEALSDFKKAANLDLSFAESYLDQCEKLKLDFDCLPILNRLVEKDPEKYLTRRAEYFKKHQQLGLALKDYNQAVKKSRKLGMDEGYSPKAWAYTQRGIYYRFIGESKSADEDMKKAMVFERLQKMFCGFSAYPVH
jgi:tetratricopeptide (TPR) repeat protein